MPEQLPASSAESANPGLWPLEVAALYGLDPTLDAAGQCVGIVALGGGYLPSDLEAASRAVGRPVPLVVDCSVNGATNLFGGGTDADREVALDLQIVATLIPSVRIVVYFADNSILTIADAVRAAINDEVNQPKVLSISWGSAELFWSPETRDALQTALADAGSLGITVVAAAGDYLANAGIPDSRAHVMFPASSPFVLACGGTRIDLNSAGARVSETVWNDGLSGTGGGISDAFPLPSYQHGFPLPASVNDGQVRRGVPDVAAASAPLPGYRIVLGGDVVIAEGTSAAAPLWASIISMANSRRSEPLGLPHAVFYDNPHVCTPVTVGDNRVDGIGYDAAPGWNACTGLGVPNSLTVDALVAAVRQSSKTTLPSPNS